MPAIKCIDGLCRCQSCGWLMRVPVGVVAMPHACRRGLGDMVKAGLDAVGVTQDRVQAVAARVGIKDCGCKRRQQRLNELGRKIGIGR